MIVGIIMGSFGIILSIISSGTLKQTDTIRERVCDHALEIKASAKRIEILERQNDVTTNELRHINGKLDELKEMLKKKR